MTTLARRVAAVPVRTSVETWTAVCSLLAPPGTDARAELARAARVAAVLISEEYTAQEPIIVVGSGPRVKVYTVHGEDADGALRDESPLPASPCQSGEWEVSLPCGADDLEEMRSALVGLSRFSVRLPQAAVESSAASSLRMTARPVIDLSELERP